MKFVSKQSNYRIVLKHGQQAEPITGRVAVPGMHIKFENGMVNVENEETCEMMKRHPGFNADFILAEEENKDPWIDSRKESEPEHDVTKIEYGHVGESLNPKPKISLTREKQKVLKEMAKKMAIEMAKEMAPKLAKNILEKLAKGKQNKKGVPDSSKEQSSPEGKLSSPEEKENETHEINETNETSDKKID
jgi:hypothetical protein